MRLFLAIVVALTAMVLTSCDNSEPKTSNQNRNSASRNSNTIGAVFTGTPTPTVPKSPVDPKFKSCNAYFPLVPGSVAKYVLTYSTGLVADVNKVVDAANENARPVFVETEQIVDKDGGIHKLQTAVTKYACEGDKVIIISKSSDNRADENETHTDTDFGVRATAFPEFQTMKPGTSWSYTINSTFQNPGQPPVKSNQPMTFTFEIRGEQDVTVPAGTFKTLRIVRKVSTHQIDEYYVKGIGLVKRQAEDGTTMQLKEFSGLKAAE